MSDAAAQIVVLAPEDEDRVVLVKLLTARGLIVTATNEPPVATELCQATACEILIVDLALGALEVLPRWYRRRDDPSPAAALPSRGYAVLRPVARDPRIGGLPLLIVSDGVAERAAAQRFGLLDVVAKPVDGERLRAKVAGALADRAPKPLGYDSLDEIDPGLALAFDVIPRAMRRVLIVDPDARFRKWMRGLMALHGFRVSEAEHAEQGLTAALSERPWLVLCEVKLSGDTDGLAFCRGLRGHALTARLPVVLLSAHDQYEDRYRGIEAGADDFVSKHVTAREMLIRIQLVLKRYAKLGTPVGREGAAIGGRLELVGPPGVLQMCHLSQLTGFLRVRNGGEVAEFGFQNGQIVSARTPEGQGAEAVYAFMEWSEGHFEFVPGRPHEGLPLAGRFDELLLEGCRRFDERRRERMPDAVGN